ncbi:MAG: type II toxin-antitoxin system VapC family toxin [Verrucomicrobiota bacterium]
MKVLLDTCTFLWLTLEHEKLSPLAAITINDEANEFFLSDVSLWEISLKNLAGKLPLPDSPEVWLREQRSFHNLTPLAIRETAIFLTSNLPAVHSDPFDRLIAAQAIENHLTILSPDRPLSLLGANRIW